MLTSLGWTRVLWHCFCLMASLLPLGPWGPRLNRLPPLQLLNQMFLRALYELPR